MTHKQSRVRRKTQQFFDRAIQRAGMTTWKIAPCRTNVRHKHCVTHKDGIAKLIGDTGRRMTWYKQCATNQLTNRDLALIG